MTCCECGESVPISVQNYSAASIICRLCIREDNIKLKNWWQILAVQGCFVIWTGKPSGF